MQKIGTSKDLDKIINELPTEIFNKCVDFVNILVSEYGEDRDIERDYGGFVAILDKLADIEELKEQFNYDLYNDSYEEIDFIETYGKTYISVLYIQSSDFGINVMADKAILPIKLLNKWEV